MRDALTIAARDTLDMWRDGRFRAASSLLVAVLVTAFITGWALTRATTALHEEAERTERALSLDKGEMNPHAAAHFGAFVFKPIEPLSAIDPGLDPYVGVVAFLEAHQQQLARHRPVEDATPARRLGELSGAAALQVLVPLLIVLMTYPAFAGERDAGTLRQLASHGVGRWTLAAGKIGGAVVPLVIVLAPATLIGAVALVWTTPPDDGDGAVRAMLLAGTYVVYFLIWAGVGLVVSARSRTATGALTMLMAIWFVSCFVAAPLASAVATSRYPSMTASAFTLAIDEARHALPRWDERVAQVEQRFLSGALVIGPGLPSNPEVIALVEAELEETALYDRVFEALFDAYDRQAAAFESVGWLAPALAVQSLSMGLAGTDYTLHRQFTRATTRYRQQFVQTLNAELAAYDQTDTFDYTRGRELWSRIPPFEFEAPSGWWSVSQHRASVWTLGLWLLVATGTLGWSVATLRVD